MLKRKLKSISQNLLLKKRVLVKISFNHKVEICVCHVQNL